MGYEIISSINRKKGIITSYSSNCYPRDYSKFYFNKGEVNDKEFMIFLIDNLLDGNFRMGNRNSIYHLITERIRALPEYKDFYKKRDDNFDKGLEIDFNDNLTKEQKEIESNILKKEYQKLYDDYKSWLPIKIYEIENDIKKQEALFIVKDTNNNYIIKVVRGNIYTSDKIYGGYNIAKAKRIKKRLNEMGEIAYILQVESNNNISNINIRR